MPIYTPYPGPGAGISTAGLNKTAGWGSPPLYIGDAGINKTAGKSLSGLDQNSNPVITSFNVTGITGTGATITWTTNVARPLGSVRWRLASGGAWTTVAEAGTPPLTTHSVPLTGLALSKVYEYEVTQPGSGTGAKAGKQVYQGRFTTLAAGELAAPDGVSSGGDGLMNTTGVTDSRDLLNGSSSSSSTPAFPINLLQAVGERDEVTVTWRTEVYADGTVMYRPVGGQAATVDEVGVKRLNHSVTLSGLAPNTEYEVAVISADAQGNTSEAGPIRVRTTA
jgi:hypothetical protein